MARTFAPTSSAVDYHPTGGNAYQRLDFYTPDASVARPVLIVFPDSTDGNFGGSVARPTELSVDQGLPYFAYLSGFAIAWASYTVTDDSLSGDGLFGAAEHAEKDAQRVAQYLRQNASALGINSARILGYGIGSGATAIAYAAFAPDGADAGSVNPAETQSTRLTAVALIDPVANWDSCLDTLAATHFSITPSDTLGDISSGTLDGASLLSYGFPGVNTAVPAFLAGRGAAVSSDYASPYPTNSESLTSAWHALAAHAALAAETAAFHSGTDARSEAYDASDGIPSDASLAAKALDFLIFEAGLMAASEVVIRMLERRLAEITLANGYATDFVNVYRYGSPDADGDSLPALMLATLTDDFDEENSASRDTVTLRVGLTLALEGAESSERRTSAAIADIRKRIKADRQFGGQVDNVELTRARRFLDATESGERCGATAEVVIQYLEQVEDPFILAPDGDGAGPYI